MPNLMKCHDMAVKNDHFLHEAPENGFVSGYSIKSPSKLQLFLEKNNC